MTIWKNSRADVYFHDDKPELNDPGYEVRITGDELVVSYQGSSGWVNYTGRDLGGGHYELAAPEVDGRAMLHRCGDSEFLEGYWSEGSEHGLWRVYLAD